MVVISKTAARYLSSNRSLHTSKSRVPWRHRTRAKNLQQKALTPAEKKLRAQQREEKNALVRMKLDAALIDVWKRAESLHEDLGMYTVKYWYEKLLQHSTKPKHNRATSRWNAFLSKEVRARNDALPSGTPRLKVNDLCAELRVIWHAMSQEEKDAATEDELVRIAELKDMKKSAAHSVPITAFHDTRATLASIETQLEELHNRTGLDTFMVSVRTDDLSRVIPQVWMSSNRADIYFKMMNNMTLSEYAGRYESYCLSGLRGAANTCENEILALKKQTSKLILDKLVDIARPDTVSKMSYTNFEDRITERLGIYIEGWPLSEFQAPGNFGSRIELQTLHNAWLNGTTRFRRMSKAEHKVWYETKLAKLKEATAAAAQSNVQVVTDTASSNNSPAIDTANAAAASSSLDTNLSAGVPGVQTAAPSSVAGPSTGAHPAVTTPQLAPVQSFEPAGSLMTVFSINGVAPTVAAPRPQKKKRKDAGVKKGPNAVTKRKLAAAQAAQTNAAP